MQQGSGALIGCRVLELGGYVAAPFASLLLGYLGAEVIKVEGLRGDPSRQHDSIFLSQNVGKKSLAVDLTTREGAEVFQRLVRASNVVISNLSPEANIKLGTTYDHCRAVSPDIIYCLIRAFGEGSYSGRPATNPIVEALTGLMSANVVDGRPARQGASFCDQLAGAMAALGAVAAVNARAEDVTRLIEVDLYETGLFQVAPQLVERQLNPQKEVKMWDIPGYGTYQLANGHWIYLGLVNDSFWRRFCTVMRLDDVILDDSLATLALRMAQRDRVDAIVSRALLSVDPAHVVARLVDAGVSCAPVLSFDEVLTDKHASDAMSLVAADGHDSGIRVPGPPFGKPSGGEGWGARGAPQLGENSNEILELLGYSASQRSDLSRAGTTKAMGEPGS